MDLQRNEIISVTTLLEGWSKVVKILYRQLRRDGVWQLQDRELLDRGDGVTILLYNQERRTVLLLRQPRILATLKGHGLGETIEACNGLVENEDPLVCARREVEQETGHKPLQLQPIAQVYASPGASLEVIHLFLGRYDESTRVAEGGGISDEGEDIEVLEIPFETALRWIDEKTICDARTILALQYVRVQGIL